MNQDRWRQIDELFDAAFELPDSERERFLSTRCNGDEALKKEVLSLLKAQSESDKFMENSAMNLLGKAIAADKPDFFESSLYNKNLGNYKIEKPLGAGGMGEIYLAQDAKLNRKVALKILPKEFVTDKERVKRFEIEARAVSALNHPYIVTVYDVGNTDGVSYIATEYVEGKTVRELIGAGTSLKEILSIISQSAEALAAAHKAGIIHRDIKPENIMVRPDGYVKVLDFGLAKLAETNPEMTAQTMKGAVIGTLAYMSPAQVSGDAVDHRADLWSLGVVLYEMLTGKSPFKSENRQATFNSILSFEPEPASEFNSQVTPELDRILQKALEKDADLSYQSASDFCADIKRVRREFDSSPSLKSGSIQSIERKKQRRKRNFLAVASGALALILIASAIWFFAFKRKTVEAADWTKAKLSQLTDFSGIEDYPNLSPDGKILLYSREIDDNVDIYWQRIGGTNPQNLTPDSPDYDDYQPAFSPDGEHIAFRSSRSGGGIFLMGATGESVKQLTDFGFNPSWSPDGKEIVFGTVSSGNPTSRPRFGEIWTVNVATGEKRRIETTPDAVHPSISPNGKRIAYWGMRTIWTAARAGGDAVQVTADDKFSNWSPVWSPDGNFLYFCSNMNGGAGVWRVAIDEETGKPLGEPENVVAPGSEAWYIALSRDGKDLVYMRQQIRNSLQSVEFSLEKKQIVGEPVSLTQATKRSITPSVSPDGEWLVFQIFNDSQEDIAIIKTDGSKQSLLTNDEALDRLPKWSADGKQILFTSSVNNVPEIFSIKPDGSDRKQITSTDGSGAFFPNLSPDGTKLIYAVSNSTSKIIDLGKPFSQQTPLEIPYFNEEKEKFVGWSWSPDGKKIVGYKNSPNGAQKEIWVYHVDSRTLEKLCDIGFRPSWLSDNRHIIFTSRERLFLLDSETKKEKEILSLQPFGIYSSSITRDMRKIFYNMEKIERDIHMLSLK